MTEDQAYKSTPHDELIAQIMSEMTPKTEREHAAKREIERLSQRTFVGLTDQEIETLWQNTAPYYDHQDFARAIEAAHGIKEKNQ